MKIAIKSLFLNARFSRETTCYHATFLVDGVPAFTGENDGGGGCDHFRPVSGRHELLAKAQEFAKSLPPVRYHDTDLPMDLELLVGQLIAARDLEKRYDRLTKTAALVVEDGKVWSYKAQKGAPVDALIAALVAKGKRVLNAMPRDEALTLFGAVE